MAVVVSAALSWVVVCVCVHVRVHVCACMLASVRVVGGCGAVVSGSVSWRGCALVHTCEPCFM